MTTILTEREILVEVLDTYKDLPCLWDPTNEQYMHRDARNQALEKLRECYSKFRAVTLEEMKKKIEHMRASYRRERLKVERSKSSGAGADEVHIPSLWYFDHLSFLNEKQTPSAVGIDNFENDGSDSERYEPEMKKRKRSKGPVNDLIIKQSQLVDAAQKMLENCGGETSAESFGRSVASQLKDITNSRQRYLAEKIIQDTLFHAKMNELDVQGGNANSARYQESPPPYWNYSRPSTSRISTTVPHQTRNTVPLRRHARSSLANDNMLSHNQINSNYEILTPLSRASLPPRYVASSVSSPGHDVASPQQTHPQEANDADMTEFLILRK